MVVSPNKKQLLKKVKISKKKKEGSIKLKYLKGKRIKIKK